MSANPDYRPAAYLIVLLECVAAGAASLVPFYTRNATLCWVGRGNRAADRVPLRKAGAVHLNG